MALFDVPTHDGYKILTHSSTRRFQKNGFAQVGNKLFPDHPIAPQSVKKSSIYNKNISGIAEAGYGKRYPYYGLSKYPGAGSPRASLSNYSGAGSPRSSLAYAGAGSPRTSLTAYQGAGSPRRSLLADAYINDNPPPGTLHPRLSGLSRAGIKGRPSNRVSLRGLSDDTTAPAADDWNWDPAIPEASPTPVAGSGVLSTLTNALSNLFGTSVSAATSSGGTAIAKAIQGAANPPSAPVTPYPALSTTTKIFGMSATTVLLLGGVSAYFLLKKS